MPEGHHYLQAGLEDGCALGFCARALPPHDPTKRVLVYVGRQELLPGRAGLVALGQTALGKSCPQHIQTTQFFPGPCLSITVSLSLSLSRCVSLCLKSIINGWSQETARHLFQLCAAEEIGACPYGQLAQPDLPSFQNRSQKWSNEHLARWPEAP